MDRPDLSRDLEPLKPFQRRTVDHAFDRLFIAKDSSARFLVADEVGLGKTLVARGVIARTIEHLWSKVGRIDIIYICSNASIAHSNLRKLQVGGGAARPFATRLTMLATELAGDDGRSLADNRLNFVSFTPGTSFNLRSSGGRMEEREVLFHLLKDRVSRRVGLMNLLQMGVGKDKWRRQLKVGLPLDRDIQQRFLKSYVDTGMETEVDELIDLYFRRYRRSWPMDAHRRRRALVGELRTLLAKTCVDALEPDLVILDEFQRFKTLLEPSQSDPAVELAQSLFNAITPEGERVRMLLLSATPYKLYTADAEIEREDHYKDFIATTRFLFSHDEDRIKGLQRDIKEFGAALKAAASGGPERVLLQTKQRIQERLCQVMARTERVTATVEGDSMVVEDRTASPALTVADVQQYLCAAAIFRTVGDRDPMPYWKSASYITQFMHGYRFNYRLSGMLGESPEKLREVTRSHAGAMLRRPDLEQWQALDPGNAKLRDVVSDLLDGGLWRLLWLPPTVPYWELKGPFSGMERVTKSLLFSAWNVVPDVVSGILSYEAERRMVEGSRVKKYENPEGQQARLLRLDSVPRSRHRLFLLLLPCLPLADIHPLSALAAGAQPRDWVRARVAELLGTLPDPQQGPEDDRWEWALPLLLDSGLRPFLKAWRYDNDLPHPNPEHFGAYVDDLLGLDPSELGRRPRGLLELMTDLALGSPAILAARSASMSGVDARTRRRVGVRVAEAFWHLFNRPAVISLLTGVLGGSDRERYWRRVLRYCQQGNLQAVLDEQWHLLWEQRAWGNEVERDSVAESCAASLAESIRPKPSRVHLRLFDDLIEGRSNETDELRIRTIFALRYGTTSVEVAAGAGEQRLSQEIVREAFNSPFRPFVLANTSIGQEGLDFHPWCHRIVHWDLPGNPVDLEQREGRVHRYKGHAVRRNVAALWRDAAVRGWEHGDDLWERLFEIADAAARESGESDLVPCWVASGDYRVERRVPLLPYTKEESAFKRLKRQLAAYRVVFGQPRQEELLSLLDQSEWTERRLHEWAIDLSPPRQ